MECEMRIRDMKERPAGRKYLARTRSVLYSSDIQVIIDEYKTKNITQAEIAKKYKVTKTLVQRLLKEDKN